MAIVDYVSGTVQGRHVEEVLQYVSRFSEGWVQGKGAHGYKACWASDGFRLFYDGSEGMGVYFQASGEGCARIVGASSFDTWGAWFEGWQEFGFRASRVDLAFDNRSGLVSVAEISRKLEAGEYTSKYRAVSRNVATVEGETTKDVLYLGSMESDSSVCVYDKRLERLARGCDDPGEWLRIEMRFKGKSAVGVVSWLIENPELAGAEGFLLSSISFREPSDDQNKVRWEISPWWVQFGNESEKLRVQTVKASRSLVQHAERFIKQHSATLAMLVLCMCAGRLKGEWLDGVVMTGWGRMNKAQCQTVREAIGHLPGTGVLLHT